MSSKPVQTSYEEKNGKRKFTITVDQDAAVREAKKLAGKASDTIGKLATAGIAKAKEFANKIPSVDLKIKENVATPESSKAAKTESANKPATSTSKKPATDKKSGK